MMQDSSDNQVLKSSEPVCPPRKKRKQVEFSTRNEFDDVAEKMFEQAEKTLNTPKKESFMINKIENTLELLKKIQSGFEQPDANDIIKELESISYFIDTNENQQFLAFHNLDPITKKERISESRLLSFARSSIQLTSLMSYGNHKNLSNTCLLAVTMSQPSSIDIFSSLI